MVLRVRGRSSWFVYWRAVMKPLALTNLSLALTNEHAHTKEHDFNCLFHLGHHAVILACRSLSRGEDLKARLEADTVKTGRPKPHIEVIQLAMGPCWIKSWNAPSLPPL